MEKTFDLIIKMVDDTKKFIENYIEEDKKEFKEFKGIMNEKVSTHNDQLIVIQLQLKQISEALEQGRGRTVWIKRAFAGALISSTVGAMIGAVVFLIKGG